MDYNFSGKEEGIKGWNRQDFINYLEKTLIPDLHESGSTFTAEDFETAVFFIKNPLVNFKREW